MSVELVTILAAEEANTRSNPLIPHTNELIWGFVSFVLLFALLAKFVFPTISRTLQERSENIEGKLQAAERQRQEAQALLQQYQAKLEQANTQAQQLLEQARSNADRLEVELRGKAEDQARRIVERAQESIHAERDRVLQQLRTEVGTLAIDLASRVVGDSLNDERQLRLIDQYISELPKTERSEVL